MARAAQRRIRVLVADDEATLRLLLAAELELADDIELVGEAWDGVEAVEQTINLKPDVVIMDIRMPRLSGIQATERIAEVLPGTRVVILTNSPDLRDEDLSLAAGAVRYLEKLANVNSITDVVRDAYNAQSARAAVR